MKQLNQHIVDYLSYYISLDRAPEYAVMVRGPWGCGKSHLVRGIVGDALKDSTKKSIYVSLYGLQSAKQIDDALFQAAYPALADRSTKVLTRIGKTALKFFNIDPQLEVGDLLDKFDFDLFVFDDLERCDCSKSAALGYINEFVEHQGRKVIVVAHEGEIDRSKKYRSRREKLIGKTLEVRPDFEPAYRHFANEFTEGDYRKCLLANLRQVQSVFEQSQTANLRVVRHTLGEFDRLFSVLKGKHKKNAEAMTALLKMIFALSFELKAGRLATEDLHQRKNLLYAKAWGEADKEDKNKQLASSRRYPDVALDSDLLSDDLVCELLAQGRVEPGTAVACLDASRYFVSALDEPPWRTLWHALDRTAEEFERALRGFEEQYAARKFTVAGEILHALSIRLWLSKEGFIAETPSEIEASGRAYIDEVHESGQLQPYPLHDSEDDTRHNSFGGLGFHEPRSAEFIALRDYLTAKRLLAREQTYSALAVSLMDELLADPLLFARRICWNESGDSTYSRIPLLSKIPASQLLDVVLDQHPEYQRLIFAALRERYKDGWSELSDEKDWLESFKRAFRDRLPKMAAFDQFRCRKLEEWYLTDLT